MPKLVVHLHFNKHIAGIQQTLAGHLFAVAEFDNLFRRNQHLAKTIGESERLCSRLKRFGYLLFKSGISVNDVPMFGGVSRLVWTRSSIGGLLSGMRGVLVEYFLVVYFLGGTTLVRFQRIYAVVLR